jgi:LysR family transcriptional regulator, cys regulon transcriptional activator
MTLAQLRYLIAIVDAGLNITLAAERVHATQPGLSKQLRQLESELGFQLIKRRGKSLEAITPEGAEVVERARSIVDEAARIRALATTMRRDNGGSLTIATSHTQARFVLPPYIAALKNEIPALTVRVNPCGRDEALAQVAQGQADVALVSTSAGMPTAALALPAYLWQQVVIVPRGHALARGPALTIERLAAHPLVSYDSTVSAQSALPRIFAEHGHRPTFACTAQDADLIKTYVRSGLGVGIIAQMAVVPGEDDLVVLPLAHLLPDCTTWLVPRPDRVMTAPLEFLLSRFTPHLDRIAVRRWLAGDRLAPVQPRFVPTWPLEAKPAVSAGVPTLRSVGAAAG